ncbi:MAG: YifB family Mg chelatase-like AAA ATPase [Bacteroidales bacterium]|nr:YifB family Mg chelatase-like AAA ATPase [Bacteroidales bacterium]
MLTHVYGAKCIGIDAIGVTVEVDISLGIGVHLCGLADVAVKESLLRTVTALQSQGYRIPGKKIVINLAPADTHKNGSGYDLPIAIGIIAASEQESLPNLGRYLLMGELGLDATVRSVPGGLPTAELARQEGFEGCILPYDSAMEAAQLEGIRVYGVRTMKDAILALSGSPEAESLLVSGTVPIEEETPAPEMDFADIIGQENAKRGVEIAAAGGHCLILIGSPGSGKSSLAKAMAGILPPLTMEESLVTSKIYSVAGRGNLRCGFMRSRPFRAPHYSASLPAIIGGGGGDGVFPGEVSLAHSGVLFIDEIAHMPKSTVEALRGPLEDRKVTISRLKTKVEYPASFTLVAASNPCPCGYYGEGDRCTCTPTQRLTYISRLSGPIMDRIDLQVTVRSISPTAIAERSSHPRESSAEVAARVLKAREIQRQRFAEEGINCNAEMNNRQIERYCKLSPECQETMQQLVVKMQFSMRAYYRIIKVARTIADLEGARDISVRNLLEAAGYRFLDRQNILR